ncbi:MAG: DUF2793 domain-containing protein [Paracoccus sp. (in: a-proteobacteria)]|nr:DUF2793 domain-containing protein [Paracoccus sp. (in: a-proteobacteria)]
MATITHRLPLIAEGQAQPHVTHNAALDLIDAALPRIAASASQTAPPSAPVDGAAYILPPAAVGWGDASPGDVAIWTGGRWHKVTPRPGWRWLVGDEGAHRVFDGAAWRRGDVIGAQGAGLALAVIDRVVTATGANVVLAGIVPARAVVLGVSTWVVQRVTGATSYAVGRAAGGSDFGSGLGVAAGSSNIGVVGPYATYEAAGIHITAAGGNFTGGRIGIAVSALVPSVPL